MILLGIGPLREIPSSGYGLNSEFLHRETATFLHQNHKVKTEKKDFAFFPNQF